MSEDELIERIERIKTELGRKEPEEAWILTDRLLVDIRLRGVEGRICLECGEESAWWSQ